MMFGKLKGFFGGSDATDALVVHSPLDGESISVSEVNDPTFSDGLLGKGIAVKPSGTRIVSPVDGIVTTMFKTGHAVTITSGDGLEILIHVGLDTVKLDGQHFTIHANTGDEVKVGDLLLEFDRDKILAEGYDVITPVVLCNSDDYKSVDTKVGATVHEKEEIMKVHR